jgi:hypothetical protein
METLTRVDLDLKAMRRVVEREGGCIVWGGAIHLSPVDDLLIRVERALDLDSDAQLVASCCRRRSRRIGWSRPDHKVLPLVFLADAARALGAKLAVLTQVGQIRRHEAHIRTCTATTR